MAIVTMLIELSLLLALRATLVKAQCSGTTTLTSLAQATSLSDCTTFDGDITIDPDIAPTLALNTLTTVTGDLYLSYGKNLTSFSAEDLVTVGGELSIRSIDFLATVSLPKLDTIRQLDLYDLPALTNEGWTSKLTNVTNVRIKRTGFRSLDWLTTRSVDDLSVDGNGNLTDISLGINAATGSISISDNGPEMVLALPNLQLAGNITVERCAEISLPELTHVNRSVGLLGNAFTELSMPKLLTLDSTLMLWNNTALTKLEIPVLANVSGDVIFHGNSKLQQLELPDLGIVEGDVLINGSLTRISMPALTDIQGDILLNSDTTLDCSRLDPYDASNVFKGQYQCIGGTAASNDSPGTSDSAAPPSGLSNGAKGGIAAGVIIGVLLVGLGLYFWWRKRKAATSQDVPDEKSSPQVLSEINSSSPAELGEGRRGPKTVPELSEEAVEKHSELDSVGRRTMTLAELPERNDHPRYELGS